MEASRSRKPRAIPAILLAAAAALFATAVLEETPARAVQSEKADKALPVNPADQRNEMIRLLRSIDERLKRIDETLAKPKGS